MTTPSAAATGWVDVEDLLQHSLRLGADTTLVIHGGGNTSAKGWLTDPFGRDVETLVIKASGFDLRSIHAGGFVALRLDELRQLRARERLDDGEMVALLRACTLDPDSPRPSIETLLHAWLPMPNVDHVHADRIVALTHVADPARIVRDALGERVAYVPYLRPGFELSRQVAELADAEAIVLGRHGLVTWGATSEESYGMTLEIVARAEAYLAKRSGSSAPARVEAETGAEAGADELELLPRLRGLLSKERRQVLQVERDARDICDRADRHEIAAAGPATADHLLRIRPWSITFDSKQSLETALEAYRVRYSDYVEAHRDRIPPGYEPFPALPAVALVPGVGIVAAGRSSKRARATAETAVHSHRVAATVIDAFGQFERWPDVDLFDLDYWPLELYKLKLAPAEQELTGRIAIVTGAASGIGREIARLLAASGAELVLADLNAPGLQDVAAELTAGTGRDAIAVDGDLRDPGVSQKIVEAAVRKFGGLDAVVSNAGIAAVGRLRDLTDEAWQQSMDINLSAHFYLTRAAWPIFERQGIGGSLVYICSKNAFAPGAGFGAYSAAKAGEVQVARIAALEGGEIGVRANVVNPDAIFEGSGLWTDAMREERAREHGVTLDGLEDFYAQRNVLKRRVTGKDVAEAVLFLVSDRSLKTTGAVISVDGGVPGAFAR
jgi:rhamnulose-1-phosphate aldolase/alcohol dehydrogenase